MGAFRPVGHPTTVVGISPIASGCMDWISEQDALSRGLQIPAPRCRRRRTTTVPSRKGTNPRSAYLQPRVLCIPLPISPAISEDQWLTIPTVDCFRKRHRQQIKQLRPQMGSAAGLMGNGMGIVATSSGAGLGMRAGSDITSDLENPASSSADDLDPFGSLRRSLRALDYTIDL